MNRMYHRIVAFLLLLSLLFVPAPACVGYCKFKFEHDSRLTTITSEPASSTKLEFASISNQSKNESSITLNTSINSSKRTQRKRRTLLLLIIKTKLRSHHVIRCIPSFPKSSQAHHHPGTKIHHHQTCPVIHIAT